MKVNGHKEKQQKNEDTHQKTRKTRSQGKNRKCDITEVKKKKRKGGGGKKKEGRRVKKGKRTWKEGYGEGGLGRRRGKKKKEEKKKK
ncbi:hypothetical protein HIR72_05585 [Pasteurella multocida]|uniref:hypothetical protein n=1 Tax=Pasteurella multocida TaxID=747 RepID=UPI0014615934|nr:hypothetical protein [Pasteurella multocida]NMR60138.1 hypothetical protein [Pasteurella multocida]